jgi:tRNA(Ile)-lysidine synthetase-like protein
MRIVRGTRFENYAGIKEKYNEDNVFFIRPLLKITKHEILEYAKNQKIQYFEDTSNKEDIYTRNRYRHHIIPSIEKENPNYREKISQLSDMITHASSLVQTECDTYIKSLDTLEDIYLEGFNALNKLVKIAVLTYLINTLSNNTIEVNYHQYESIIKLCESETPNQFLTLDETYSFIKNYETFSIKRLKKQTTINIEINDYGTYQVTDKISYIISPNKIGQNNRNYFELWYNGLVFPLYLRNRLNGDKMQLKVGTKKVEDILIDQKIPLQLRDSLILLADNESVLWIPGIKKSNQNQTQKNKLYVYEVTKC